MHQTLRSLSRNSRRLVRTSTAAPIRSFHTPFAPKGNSPLTSPPPPDSSVSSVYEKQSDPSPEPVTSHSGTRTYVVSEQDASSKFHEVPSGAYPTSAPYVNFTATEAPDTDGYERSSTSSSPLTHPQTTRTVPQHEGGVGESSAVRHAEAPGEMGERSGSHGGQGLMDKQGTVPGEGTTTDRNPPPLGDMAEKFSKQGIDNAWKNRK